MSSLLNESPKGELLALCLPYFLRACTHKNQNNIEKFKLKLDEKNQKNKNEKAIAESTKEIGFIDEDERTDRILAVLEALSELFIEEIKREDGNDEESSSSAHVHSASCTHDHDIPVRYHHKIVFITFLSFIIIHFVFIELQIEDVLLIKISYYYYSSYIVFCSFFCEYNLFYITLFCLNCF